MALYQGVCPIEMEFSDDAEKTFGNALSYLLVTTSTIYPLHFFGTTLIITECMIKDKYNLLYL